MITAVHCRHCHWQLKVYPRMLSWLLVPQSEKERKKARGGDAAESQLTSTDIHCALLALGTPAPTVVLGAPCLLRVDHSSTIRGQGSGRAQYSAWDMRKSKGNCEMHIRPDTSTTTTTLLIAVFTLHTHNYRNATLPSHLLVTTDHIPCDRQIYPLLPSATLPPTT